MPSSSTRPSPSNCRREARTSARAWRRSSPSVPPSSKAADVTDTHAADARVALDAATPLDQVTAIVGAWVEDHVPPAWREAAERGGHAAIRGVRSRQDYEDWYPVFGHSG